MNLESILNVKSRTVCADKYPKPVTLYATDTQPRFRPFMRCSILADAHKGSAPGVMSTSTIWSSIGFDRGCGTFDRLDSTVDPSA